MMMPLDRRSPARFSIDTTSRKRKFSSSSVAASASHIIIVLVVVVVPSLPPDINLPDRRRGRETVNGGRLDP